MNKIIKFHFENGKVISTILEKKNENVEEIINTKWFINIEHMAEKYICINLNKVIFIEVCNENN